MSSAIALILLVEATSACGAVAPVRLGGGAEIAPAILKFDPQESESLAPTPAGASQAPVDAQSETNTETNQPDQDPGAGQCKMVTSAIA